MTEKPLIYFDLETTGVNIATDRIVEISAIKDDKEISMLINPKMPIPESAIAVHGITNEMVADKPTLEEVSQELYEFFKGCDLAGFNHINFDVPLLAEEFARCGYEFPDDSTLFVDMKTIFHKKEERTLSAAVKFYCGEDHENAHSSLSDTKATKEIHSAMIERYPDLPADRQGLHDYCFDGKPLVDFAGKLTKNDKGEIVFNFGKNKGIRVTDEIEYARWMFKSDFPLNTKNILKKIFTGANG